jgi:3-oxoacyl-[acyl-carrier protein] reductase
MNRLTGKTALITGAARGLGAAIARRYYEEGARVIVNDLDLAAASETARALDGLAFAADVSDAGAVNEMFEAVDAQVGALDILVNNAGISGLEGNSDLLRVRSERSQRQQQEIAAGGPIETHLDVTIGVTDEAWHRMIGVHLNGTFFCTRAALHIMNRNSHGAAIINMGSIMGTAGGEASPHYSAAKAGILGLTRALARELASRHIRVNAIAPGWIDTDMTVPLGPLREKLAALTPLRRFGDVDDIAWAAVYLASEEAKYMTGQVISPNGGYVMSQ